MPDNRVLLKESLGELGLAPQREEEILRELGDHVEDHAAALEARGVSQEAAAREALDSVSDWLDLRQEILRAETEEGNMNYRTKVFWLPSMCALAISSGLLAVFQHVGLAPRFYWLSGEPGTYHPYFFFYVPWLIALPVVGAGAAFWSQLAGGKALHRMLAALAPSIGMLGFFLIFVPFIAWPIGLVLMVHYHMHISFSLTGHSLVEFIIGFLVLLANWVLLPAIALFIGAAPFLRKPHAQSS
jgi:hypothetical protein